MHSLRHRPLPGACSVPPAWARILGPLLLIAPSACSSVAGVEADDAGASRSAAGDSAAEPSAPEVDGSPGAASPDDGGTTTDAISIAPPVDDADAPATDAGPGGPWVAFVSNRTGDFDVYLVHPDGTGLRPLVQRPGMDLSPAWSPEGARIAFESNAGTDAGAWQVSVVDVASGAITLVSTGLSSATSPVWSPDGTRLAVGGPGGLYVVPSAGGTATPLTSGSYRDNSPAWSPDGTLIYFSSDRESGGSFDVWSVQPDGGGLAQVTSGTAILGGPALGPDRATLAFAQSGPSATQVSFFSMGAKTTSVFSAAGDYEPSFSPDGDHLAVTSTRYDADNPEVVILDIPGATSPFRLTDSPGVDGQAAFQPQP